MNSDRNKSIQDTDRITINLTRLVKAVFQHIWIIAAAGFVFGSASYLGTKAWIAPTYCSSFTAYVNNKSSQENGTVTSSDITAARSLASTYSAILVSQPVLEDAAEDAGLDLAYGELSGAVTTSVVDDTEIIRVSVTLENPEDAMHLARALADAAPAYIAKIVEGSSMRVIAAPKLPTAIAGPNYLRNTELGAALGILLAAVLIVLKELVDDRVKNENELEERYGIAVMGTIPDLVEAKKKNTSRYQ